MDFTYGGWNEDYWAMHEKLPNLEEIRLFNYASGVKINLSRLTAFKKLKSITVSAVGVTEKKFDFLAAFKELRVLSLGINTNAPIKGLGLSESLAELKHLQQLHLYLDLKQIPSEICELEELVEFSYVGFLASKITELPLGLDRLTKLRKFSVSTTKIKQIPSEIGRLKQLQELTFADSKLKTLPATIIQLDSLEYLDLSDNKFELFPKEICALSTLKGLDLRGNQLTNLPDSLDNLTELEWLALDFNQLKQLPKNIGKLKHLKELYLGYNQIEELPAEITALKNLQFLNLQGNPISEVTLNKLKKALPTTQIRF